MTDQRSGGISWTDETWNPIRGCSRVSEGCRNCYAERVAARFSGPGQPFEGLARMGDNGPRWTGAVRLVDEHLADPLRWRRPRRVFVNSVSDLFHGGLTNEQIAAVFGIMAAAPQHTFQILTKRPARMLDWFQWAEKAMEGRYRRPAIIGHAAAYIVGTVGTNEDSDRLHNSANIYAGFNDWPLPNVWLGVSVEDQAAADERIPLLLQTPAAVRFLSCEPLLGPVTFRWASWTQLNREPGAVSNHLDGLKGVDWVITGGESGPGSRPMHPDWVFSLRDECQEAGVPFHFKQWGDWRPVYEASGWASEDIDALYPPAPEDDPEATMPCKFPSGLVWPNGYVGFRPLENGTSGKPHQVIRVGKKAAGRILDGRTWDEFPAEVAR